MSNGDALRLIVGVGVGFHLSLPTLPRRLLKCVCVCNVRMLSVCVRDRDTFGRCWCNTFALDDKKMCVGNHLALTFSL